MRSVPLSLCHVVTVSSTALQLYSDYQQKIEDAIKQTDTLSKSANPRVNISHLFQPPCLMEALILYTLLNVHVSFILFFV